MTQDIHSEGPERLNEKNQEAAPDISKSHETMYGGHFARRLNELASSWNAANQRVGQSAREIGKAMHIERASDFLHLFRRASVNIQKDTNDHTPPTPHATISTDHSPPPPLPFTPKTTAKPLPETPLSKADVAYKEKLNGDLKIFHAELLKAESALKQMEQSRKSENGKIKTSSLLMKELTQTHQNIRELKASISESEEKINYLELKKHKKTTTISPDERLKRDSEAKTFYEQKFPPNEELDEAFDFNFDNFVLPKELVDLLTLLNSLKSDEKLELKEDQLQAVKRTFFSSGTSSKSEEAIHDILNEIALLAKTETAPQELLHALHLLETHKWGSKALGNPEIHHTTEIIKSYLLAKEEVKARNIAVSAAEEAFMDNIFDPKPQEYWMELFDATASELATSQKAFLEAEKLFNTI